MHSSLVVAGSLAVAASASVFNVSVNESRTIEVMLPARDGVNLHTVVVMPKDDDGSQKLTTIVDRSPYGYLGLEWIPGEFICTVVAL
jgi:predicted acyl esterase